VACPEPGEACPVSSEEGALTHECVGQALPHILLLLAVTIARSIATARPSPSFEPLDSIAPFVNSQQAAIAWRLARLDVARAIGDGTAIEREQESLYRYMEGKR
jgi:hypothetical protein